LGIIAVHQLPALKGTVLVGPLKDATAEIIERVSGTEKVLCPHSRFAGTIADAAVKHDLSPGRQVTMHGIRQMSRSGFKTFLV